uniref:HECT domain-containing protein n=1 Tax=Oryzias sinensis TaxID=183150 RepID=A0A8C7YSL8_9TELE
MINATELMLLQAGLGKRTINIPEDAGHKQNLFRMGELEGAWMLYKAMGGLRQRKLILVPPDDEGYSGTSITKTGKSWLYIMPIQQTLDTTPLPMSAPEFQAMPKARCLSCQSYVPLQLLGLHVKECSINEVACPLCCQPFTKEEICAHASVCGESASDILVTLEKRVDVSMTFNISVTREDLFQRGMKQWIRQKKNEGAPRKEFLTEMVRGIETQYFEGDGEKGKIPKYSILDYQDQNFKTCGEILATSLAQGGPAPNFLKTWCYNFLCHGEMEIDGPPDEVTSQDLINLKAELLELTDAIVACGYQGPITVEKRNSITAAISLHSVVRLIPILTQLREGFKLYGLTDFLAEHKQLCQELFVPVFPILILSRGTNVFQVDADFIGRALSPNLSEEGSVRRQKEPHVLNFLQDFLQNLEDKGKMLLLHGTVNFHFFQWITGHAHIPLIQCQRSIFKITVNFEHDCYSHYGEHGICYPVVNACGVSVTFPVCHLGTYSEFERNLNTALEFGYEFSRY